MIGGSASFLEFPFKLTISDDGIFAEYNLGEKFGRDEWGKTQTVRLFEEATRKTVYDEFNAIEGFIINYRVPNAYTNSLGEVSTKHSIIEIFLETYLDKSRNNILGIKLLSGSYNATVISSNHVVYEICESILSKEERIKLEEERKAIENQKKEADRLLVELKYDKIWGTKNPFDFMESISMEGKTNFFESRPTQYQKAPSTKENSFLLIEDF